MLEGSSPATASLPVPHDGPSGVKHRPPWALDAGAILGRLGSDHTTGPSAAETEALRRLAAAAQPDGRPARGRRGALRVRDFPDRAA